MKDGKRKREKRGYNIKPAFLLLCIEKENSVFRRRAIIASPRVPFFFSLSPAVSPPLAPPAHLQFLEAGGYFSSPQLSAFASVNQSFPISLIVGPLKGG